MAPKADSKKADAKKADKPKADAKKADKPKAAAAPAAAKPAAAPAAKPAAAAPAAAAKPAAAPAAAAKPAAKKEKKPKAEKKADAKPAEQKAGFLKKVAKAKNAKVTELEQAVAKALFDLETSTKDLTQDLADLFFVAAKEVTVEGNKKAVVVFVPYRQHGKYKKIQSRLIRELEKKLGRQVAIIAQRTILSKNYARANPGQARPRSRTLTAVHNAVLEDLVYPTLIVGKRLRVRVDGSRLTKIQLDPKDVKEVEGKLKSFASIYAALTNKKVEFVFPLGDE